MEKVPEEVPEVEFRKKNGIVGVLASALMTQTILVRECNITLQILTAPHGNQQGSICHDKHVAYRPLYLFTIFTKLQLPLKTSFQSTNPFPLSSSSMARAMTLRLSALKGSAYCLALICSAAASTPPLLLSFSSRT